MFPFPSEQYVINDKRYNSKITSRFGPLVQNTTVMSVYLGRKEVFRGCEDRAIVRGASILLSKPSLLFIYLLCLCSFVCASVGAITGVSRSEESLWQVLLSSSDVGPRVQIWVNRASQILGEFSTAEPLLSTDMMLCAYTL